MNLMKRAWLSILRQRGKSLILFAVLILLGSFTVGAISVSQAIQITEQNLRRQIPPIATIIQDNDSLLDYVDATGEWPVWDFSLTAVIIETIGHLPYVRTFDYAFVSTGFFSRELVFPMNLEPYLATGFDEAVLLDWLHSLSMGIEGLERMSVRGVYNPLLTNIQAGVIDLVAGRTFTEEDIQLGESVAIISQAFAEENQLTIGSTFTLEQHIYNWDNAHHYRDLRYFYHEGNLIILEQIELEVIGLFTPTVVLDEQINLVELATHMELNQLIYIPMEVAKQPEYLWFDYWCVNGEGPEHCQYFDRFIYEDVVFILYDPLDLDHFNIVASELLPDFWEMDDLTTSFRDMSASLANMRDIATWLLIGATVASFITLSLVMTLFLYDRKHEIGIYLALGDKKRHIIMQMVMEVFAISMITIAISVFAGHLTANHFSQTMLRNEMAANATPQNFDMGALNDLNRMGHGFWMTHDEMIEAYSVTLDGAVVVMFVGFSMMMVLISTVLPIIYLTKLNPKDILMKASIG